MKNYLYDEGKDEWEAGSLQAADINCDNDSHIAAGITQTGEFRIVYEDQDGDLCTATSKDGFEWVKCGKYFLDAKLLDGSALWYIRQQEGPAYLFYQNADGFIHYVEEVDSKPVAGKRYSQFTMLHLHRRVCIAMLMVLHRQKSTLRRYR